MFDFKEHLVFEEHEAAQTFGPIAIGARDHYIYHFPNGFGASIVRGPGSYGYEKGLYELAVLKERAGEWNLCYSTEITDDVIAECTVDDINAILKRIYELEPGHFYNWRNMED